MEWMARAKERGFGSALLLLLDVIEPFAPLVGQSLFVVAPWFGPLGLRAQVEQLGHLIDDPEGLAQVRSQLEEDHVG